jgi:hypothetical protein
MAQLHGKRWPRFNSVKTADIVFADLQGQDALLAQFATSKCVHWRAPDASKPRFVLTRTTGRIQWTLRAFNPYRPRLYHTQGPLAGTERAVFTVTPEEARTGAVLELRSGRHVDPSISSDLLVARPAVLPSSGLPPSPLGQKENRDPETDDDLRGKIARMRAATAAAAAAAAMMGTSAWESDY